MVNWIYSLTTGEETIAVEMGYQRQKPYFADPSRNINYSEGDLWELWQHAVCAGSELALARMLGDQDFVPSVNTFKSVEDIEKRCEVRYTFNENRGLRFTKRDNNGSIYVLMTDGLATKIRRKAPEYVSPPYKAVGWMYGWQCKIEDWRYSENTWYVPMDQLNDMESLSV